MQAFLPLSQLPLSRPTSASPSWGCWFVPNWTWVCLLSLYIYKERHFLCPYLLFFLSPDFQEIQGGWRVEGSFTLGHSIVEFHFLSGLFIIQSSFSKVHSSHPLDPFERLLTAHVSHVAKTRFGSFLSNVRDITRKSNHAPRTGSL